jgi:outer membrane autotransporter protein
VQSARDGFYLRLNLGAAYGRTLVQSDRISVPDVTSNGLGVALDVYAGWSLSRGVVLGPAFSYSGQNDPHASIGSGASAAGKSQSAALGVFVDAFPNPRLGAHFGGVLALASLTQSVSGHPELTDYSGGGLGFDVFAGYDIALGGKWCLGGLLRLGGTATTASTDVDQHALKRQGTNYGVALLVSVSRY